LLTASGVNIPYQEVYLLQVHEVVA
jgi:hypothetical protein